MRLIIYDNKNVNIHEKINDIVIYSKDNTKPCVGCFSCWVKTPENCIYKDGGSINKIMASVDEVIIISKNTFGGFSSSIKRHIDRSLSFVKPLFTFRNGMMRHVKRHINDNLKMSVCFYGKVTEKEKRTAINSVSSLAENLGIIIKNISFKLNEKEVSI